VLWIHSPNNRISNTYVGGTIDMGGTMGEIYNLRYLWAEPKCVNAPNAHAHRKIDKQNRMWCVHNNVVSVIQTYTQCCFSWRICAQTRLTWWHRWQVLTRTMRRLLFSCTPRRAMFLYSKLGGSISVAVVTVFVVALVYLRLQYRIEQLGELSKSVPFQAHCGYAY